MRVPVRQRPAYRWRWTAALGVLAVLVLSGVVWLTVGVPQGAKAAAFTVNSTDDVDDTVCNAAHCSLREAINAANANGATADTITFSVSGTITTGSQLLLTANNTTINGGTLGSVVVSCGGGFDGFHVDSASNTIRNLVINSCDEGVDIDIEAADGNLVEDNRLGTNAGGTVALGNTSYGVQIEGGADNNIVRDNLISGNTIAGVEIWGAGTNTNSVVGNLIGTDATGTGSIPNGDGIHDHSTSANVIGGTTAADRNIISGNSDDGIEISGGTSAIVQGNCIGTAVNCSTPLPNTASTARWCRSVSTPSARKRPTTGGASTR